MLAPRAPGGKGEIERVGLPGEGNGLIELTGLVPGEAVDDALALGAIGKPLMVPCCVPDVAVMEL